MRHRGMGIGVEAHDVSLCEQEASIDFGGAAHSGRPAAGFADALR